MYIIILWFFLVSKRNPLIVTEAAKWHFLYFKPLLVDLFKFFIFTYFATLLTVFVKNALYKRSENSIETRMRKTTQLYTQNNSSHPNWFLICMKNRRIFLHVLWSCHFLMVFPPSFTTNNTIEKGKSKGHILGRDRLVPFLVVDYKINRILLLGVEFNSFIRKCYGFWH